MQSVSTPTHAPTHVSTSGGEQQQPPSSIPLTSQQAGPTHASHCIPASMQAGEAAARPAVIVRISGVAQATVAAPFRNIRRSTPSVTLRPSRSLLSLIFQPPRSRRRSGTVPAPLAQFNQNMDGPVQASIRSTMAAGLREASTGARRTRADRTAISRAVICPTRRIPNMNGASPPLRSSTSFSSSG